MGNAEVIERPRIGRMWTPDGVDICEVMAAWDGGVVVKWHARQVKRRCIYMPLAAFYAEFEHYVLPFNPGKHIDRFRGQD